MTTSLPRISRIQAETLQRLTGRAKRISHDTYYYADQVADPPPSPETPLPPLARGRAVYCPEPTFTALRRRGLIEREGESSRIGGELQMVEYVCVTEYWRITDLGRAALSAYYDRQPPYRPEGVADW